MKKMFLAFLVCTVAVCGSFAPSMLNAEETAFQVPVNDDGIEAVTLELKSGTKAVVFILSETPDSLYVQNLNDSMEVSVPRANIVNMHKPTAKEVENVQKRLGIAPKQ